MSMCRSLYCRRSQLSRRHWQWQLYYVVDCKLHAKGHTKRKGYLVWFAWGSSCSSRPRPPSRPLYRSVSSNPYYGLVNLWHCVSPTCTCTHTLKVQTMWSGANRPVLPNVNKRQCIAQLGIICFLCIFFSCFSFVFLHFVVSLIGLASVFSCTLFHKCIKSTYQTTFVMNLRVYFNSRAPEGEELCDRQCRLFHHLDSLNISYAKIDVAAEGLYFLKANSPIGIQLPQVFDHKRFLGGFDDFQGAVEAGRVHDFFYSDIQARHSPPK